MSNEEKREPTEMLANNDGENVRAREANSEQGEVSIGRGNGIDYVYGADGSILYDICEGKKSEEKEIISLILDNYPYQEVVMRNHFSQVATDRIMYVEAGLGKLLYVVVSKNVTFVVKDHRTGSIVGAVAVLSQDYHSWEYTLPRSGASEALDGVTEMMDEIRERIYPSDEICKSPNIWQFAFLTIHQNHRGFKLSQKLLEYSIGCLQRIQAELIFGIFTSLRSQKVAKAAGLRTVLKVDMSKDKTVDGKPTYPDIDSDVVIKVMAIDFKKQNELAGATL